jgi:hypothetical protein
MVKLEVNGMDRSFDGDPKMPLLWYVRDTLQLTGTKFGCGIALCGACTVHKNGEAIRSCITLMSAAADSDIRTIEDSGANGLNRLEHVDTALDAGLLVHPEATREQFEGAVVFGMSIARSGEITAKNRVIQQSNFNDYPVARIKEVPIQKNAHITESSAPSGAGEPGVPPFVAAFCNAIFAASGKRVRDLPLSSNSLFG